MVREILDTPEFLQNPVADIGLGIAKPVGSALRNLNFSHRERAPSGLVGGKFLTSSSRARRRSPRGESDRCLGCGEDLSASQIRREYNHAIPTEVALGGVWRYPGKTLAAFVEDGEDRWWHRHCLFDAVEVVECTEAAYCCPNCETTTDFAPRSGTPKTRTAGSVPCVAACSTVGTDDQDAGEGALAMPAEDPDDQNWELDEDPDQDPTDGDPAGAPVPGPPQGPPMSVGPSIVFTPTGRGRAHRRTPGGQSRYSSEQPRIASTRRPRARSSTPP